jgi:hypothetical protein
VNTGSWVRSRRKFVVGISVSTLCTSASYAEPFDAEQLTIIRDTAASICNTVKEIKGEKTDGQIQGEVIDQLTGLVGRLGSSGVSGSGSLTRGEFEGLTQDATGLALPSDRDVANGFSIRCLTS